MKIIDKLLADEVKVKKAIIDFCCPGEFNFKDVEHCSFNCKECWNREIEEEE